MKTVTLCGAVLFASAVSAAPLPTYRPLHQAPLESEKKYKVPGNSPLYHCEDPKNDILSITSIDISLDPPLAGKNLTIKAKGTLNSKVGEGATISLTVKYGLVTLINTTLDLCESAAEVNLECPLEKGDLEVEREVELPKAIPEGKYNVQADVESKDGARITCLRAEVEFEGGEEDETDEALKFGL